MFIDWHQKSEISRKLILGVSSWVPPNIVRGYFMDHHKKIWVKKSKNEDVRVENPQNLGTVTNTSTPNNGVANRLRYPQRPPGYPMITYQIWAPGLKGCGTGPTFWHMDLWSMVALFGTDPFRVDFFHSFKLPKITQFKVIHSVILFEFFQKLYKFCRCFQF